MSVSNFISRRTQPICAAVLIGLNFMCVFLTGCSTGPNQPDPAVIKAEADAVIQRVKEAYRDRPSIERRLFELQHPRTTQSTWYDTMLLAHEYEQIMTKADQAEAAGTLDFDTAKARAFATDQAFLVFQREAKDAGCTSEHLNELHAHAERATAAYEAAYRLAPDDNSRMRVAGQWQWLMVQYYFNSDSQLLRTMLPETQPEHLPLSELPQQTTARYREVYRTINHCLSTHPDFAYWTDAQAMHIATVLANEYGKLEHLPHSPERFEQIIKGLPDVLVYGMSLRRRAGLEKTSPTIDESYARTFRWHVWCGISSELPSPAMRAQIDREVGAVLTQWYDAYEGVEATPDYPLSRDTIVGWGLDDYERFKDNPLVPYYKRPLRPYQAAEVQRAVTHDLTRAPEFYAMGTTRTTSTDLYAIARSYQGLERLEREMHHILDQQRFFSRGLSCSIIAKLRQPTSDSQPPMPDARIGGWGGSGNNPYGIYLISIGNTTPIPAYPWRKQYGR